MERRWLSIQVGKVLLMGWAWAMAGAVSAEELFDRSSDVIPPSLEKMYVSGLNYLVATQKETGNWEDSYGNQPAVVALAMLSILAHGDDPNTGPYSDTVKRSLNFILSQMNDQTGYIGTTMYNHGFATLALAEAYGAVNDPRLGPALRKAVNLILTSQAANTFGAWRYSPESKDADTTVSGAQMVALFAARNAGMGVPDEAIEKGLRFYEQCQSGDGGFGYTGPGGSTGSRTAIGVLVFELAKQKDRPAYKAGFRSLNDSSISSGHYYHYYLYYASQAFFHASPEAWQAWNKVNLDVLGKTQKEDGSWDGNFGPVFCTATSLLSAALNYRFLPIYER